MPSLRAILHHVAPLAAIDLASLSAAFRLDIETLARALARVRPRGTVFLFTTENDVRCVDVDPQHLPTIEAASGALLDLPIDEAGRPQTA